MLATVDEQVANAEMLKVVAGWGGRISAALVCDGGGLWVPSALGAAREDQMLGTMAERQIEVAGRACYDSLGKGRSSAQYHEHLLDVHHWSVHEHPHHTVEIKVCGWLPDYLPGLLNRPGLWTRMVAPDRLRITLDPRSVLEWHQWTLETLEIPAGQEEQQFGMAAPGMPRNAVFRGATALGILIKRAVFAAAPVIYGSKYASPPEWGRGFDLAEDDELTDEAYVQGVTAVEPETPREEWVTLYLSGSRGYSHELVRHGDSTAISQRSTRYVDESEGSWVLHPLLAAFLLDHPGAEASLVRDTCERVLIHARAGYDIVGGQLEAWLLPRLTKAGNPFAKTDARKQARGAARGLLGNALETEVIFSASVAQWLHMIRLRAADAADAEIRMGFAEAALPQLRQSRYGKRFEHIQLTPAGDGLGMSLSGGGAK